MEISGKTIAVFFTSKLFGLAPYKIKRNEKDSIKIERSKFFTFYSVFLIFVMTYLTYRGLLFDANSNSPARASFRMKSNTSKVVTALDVSVVVLSTVSGIICGLKGLKATQKLNKIIYEADAMLSLYKSHFNGQMRSYILLGISMFTISTMLGLDIWTWITKASQMKIPSTAEANVLWYMPFYTLYFILVALHVQFANSGYGISNRYKRLNSLLKDSFLNTSTKNNSQQEFDEKYGNLKIPDSINMSELKEWNTTYIKVFHKDIGKHLIMPVPPISKSSPRNIKTITKTAVISPTTTTTLFIQNKAKTYASLIDQVAYIHALLGKGVRAVSSAFGMAVVFMLVSCLLHLVATAYFLFLELMERHPKFSYLQLLWIAFHCIRLLLIVEPCHDTTVEAKKAIEIICEIERNNNNPVLARSLKKFWQQLLSDTPKFSACGMCNIDRQILTSISSAICTYLVILIQFQSSNG